MFPNTGSVCKSKAIGFDIKHYRHFLKYENKIYNHTLIINHNTVVDALDAGTGCCVGTLAFWRKIQVLAAVQRLAVR